MSFYIIIFTVSILIISLCSLKYKNSDGIIVERNELYYMSVFYVAFLLFFISAFRFNVGTDYRAYFEYAKRAILPFSFLEALNDSELFFVVFAKLSFYLCGNMQFLYVIISFTFIFFTTKGILFYEKNPLLSFVFLFVSTTFFISMNVMRQMAAFGIFLYSSKYIFSKNFKKYLFWIIVAFFWHTSALIYLFFYFLPNFNLRKLFIPFVVLAYIGKIVLNKFILTFLENTGIPIKYYFTMVEGASSKSFVLISLVVCICFLYFIKEDNRKSNFLLNISLLAVITSILIDGIPGGYRLLFMFWPMYIIICPYIIKRAKSFNYCVFLVLFAVFFIYFYRQHIVGNSGEVVPYRSILFK